MISYGKQSINEADCAAVQEALTSGWLTCGPYVDKFEQEIQRISTCAHATAVTNGTSALRLMYQVAGIGPGTKVGIPAITFVATASQAQLLGAEVILLDVDPETLLLTPELLAGCNEKLDWVIPVHVAGRMCDMPGIAQVAQERGIRILEDAAHAFGSSCHAAGAAGACTYSEAAIFSFHPVKNIACAEGGAICTNNSEWDSQLKSLRHHGIQRDNFQGPLAESEHSGPWYHEFHQPCYQ